MRYCALTKQLVTAILLSTFKATNDFNKQRVSIAKLNSRALERIPTGTKAR